MIGLNSIYSVIINTIVNIYTMSVIDLRSKYTQYIKKRKT